MAFVKTTWIDDAAPSVSAAQLNRIEAGIDDVYNGGLRKARAAWRVYISGAAPSLAAYAVVPFDTAPAALNADGVYDLVNRRMVAPVTGFYYAFGAIAFNYTAAGQFQSAFRKNQTGTGSGGVISFGSSASTSNGAAPASVHHDLIQLNAGEWIDFVPWHNAGGNITLYNNTTNTFFGGFLVGT